MPATRNEKPGELDILLDEDGRSYILIPTENDDKMVKLYLIIFENEEKTQNSP